MFKYDKEFVVKLIKKDKEAFNKFYLDSVDIFYRYVKGNYYISDSDAQDLVSTLYYKIWNALGGLDENVNFSSWVWTVLKNLVLDHIKKLKDISFTTLTGSTQVEFEDSLVAQGDLLDLMENNFQHEKIIKAMNNLDEKYKDVIFMKLVEEKSYDEISVILETSNENCRKIFSRAIKRLKELLED